ncbi:MAG: M1 family peptidase [Candidatus Aminicenantes bacterium]|nr:M1 family peptidase [Candidatus Aminicenantes bacterium]
MTKIRLHIPCVLIFAFFLVGFTLLPAQERDEYNQFRQLDGKLPTPNAYRTASGAPGPEYWQQRADYDISVKLDEENRRLYGVETITYFNHSPQSLSYLWLQLDQNIRARESLTRQTQFSGISDTESFRFLQRFHSDFDGGFKIENVKDMGGKNLFYKVVQTMMRVDLPAPVQPGSTYSFEVKYWYNLNDQSQVGGRSGFHYYEKDGNCVFAVAQFFPRMAVYSDSQGWHHKQFLGSGEFALPFGNYKVKITVPSDHVVAATGVLQNENEVLTSSQRELLARAKRETENTVLIVSEEEAMENEKSKADSQQTWIFEAEDVRDFAFASSRKFIWDAMAVNFSDHTSLAMSYYTKDGNPLWEKYSTKALAHAMKVYSKFTFEYPYPKAISVMTGRGGGMEYPMIAFNGGRAEPDGTYSERAKYGLIGVVIHEFGHNFFPMIVNSDERLWAWMDEGLNTFVEYLAEQEWERDFPERSGAAYDIAEYMKGDKSQIYPIMTAPDFDLHVGSNAYSKTATALNILRETVLGRELFDYAFKEYAERWKFKHPTPADFFRTMEDASGVDLDWFWRGWFFGTDHVDLALDNVKWYKVNTREPALAKSIERQQAKQKSEQYITNIRNKKDIEKTAVEKDKNLLDFYDENDPLVVITPQEKKEYEEYLKSLTAEEKELLQAGYNYYELFLSNKGGLVMPVILKFEYADGSEEVKRIPVEIWRRYNDRVRKVFATKKELRHVILDPFLETADVDTCNNQWTVGGKPDYFKVEKQERPSRKNLMQRLKEKK